MSASQNLLIEIVFILFALNIIGIILLFRTKHHEKKEYLGLLKFQNLILASYESQNTEPLLKLYKKNPRQFIKGYFRIAGETVPDDDILYFIRDCIVRDGWENYYLKKTASLFPSVRMNAVKILRIFPAESFCPALKTLLYQEKKISLLFSILHTLITAGYWDFLDEIVYLVNTLPLKTLPRIIAISSPQSHHWKEWAEITDDERPGSIAFRLGIAEENPSLILKNFCLGQAVNAQGLLQELAIKALEKGYPGELVSRHLYQSRIPSLKKAAIRAYALNVNRFEARLFSRFFSDSECSRESEEALIRLIKRKPELLDDVYRQFLREKKQKIRNSYAVVLSGKIQFFLQNPVSHSLEEKEKLVRNVIEVGETSLLIQFINENRNREIENLIFPMLQDSFNEFPAFEERCRAYLSPEILARWGMRKSEVRRKTKKIPLNPKDHLFLFSMMMLTMLIYPVWFFLTTGFSSGITESLGFFKTYVLRYNTFFIGYSLILNASYSLILFFAGINLVRQSNFGRLNDSEYLYSPGVLPSLSILVPAYNEEKSIIQNALNLMNLKYPDYEIIIINDGSNDATLKKLVSYFELERIDFHSYHSIKTSPIRSLFKNPRFPLLTVVDKENGGKADALNAGIIVSQNEFICSIDADSILEPDSLIKIMFQKTIEDKEILAIGGNIIPVNDCEIYHGLMKQIKLPRNQLARFQMIEYLRSFVGGRLGWAGLNSLMIISGAFGVFRRNRVLEIGGYLTGEGEHKRDTVGEDMELVVRLYRYMLDNRLPFKVCYAYNANCWTEVPENIKNLSRQRDRWHRGLIEILTYYKSMLWNPRYKTAGLIAFPYFFVFDLFGPFLEFCGYVSIILSGILGLLNFDIVLFLFFVVVLYGVFISLSSLAFSENKIVYFSKKEIGRIILAAVFENFGFRQFISLSRVFFYIEYMIFRGNKGWEKLERRGFSSS